MCNGKWWWNHSYFQHRFGKTNTSKCRHVSHGSSFSYSFASARVYLKDCPCIISSSRAFDIDSLGVVIGETVDSNSVEVDSVTGRGCSIFSRDWVCPCISAYFLAKARNSASSSGTSCFLWLQNICERLEVKKSKFPPNFRSSADRPQNFQKVNLNRANLGLCLCERWSSFARQIP